MIESVLTGPKGYWGAKARAAGLSRTSGNGTRKRSPSRRRREKPENIYYRNVPTSAKEIRTPWSTNIAPNAIAESLLKKKLHYSRKITNKYNDLTIDELLSMPRLQRKNIESKMSLDTYIKYASNAFNYKLAEYPYKALIVLAWPYFNNIIGQLPPNKKEKILKFMENIYVHIQRIKAKEEVGGITLEELAKKSDDEADAFLDENPKGFEMVYGDFKGNTLNEVILEFIMEDDSRNRGRYDEYMKFLNSFTPKEARELSFLVNLYILYRNMRGRPLPGYGDGRWTAP